MASPFDLKSYRPQVGWDKDPQFNGNNLRKSEQSRKALAAGTCTQPLLVSEKAQQTRYGYTKGITAYSKAVPSGTAKTVNK